MIRVLVALLAIGMLAVLACTSGTAGDESTPAADALRPLDPALVDLGRSLYAANCASCHGATGEGQPNWKERGPDGTLPAPPHDETGHTWHHADGLLLRIIRDGCEAYSAPTPCAMPAFGDALSDEEIVAIIEFMRTWWGPADRAFQEQATANDPFPEHLQ